MEPGITLSGKQISFLMSKYETDDPNKAVELLVEDLVKQGLDPMLLKTHIDRMMIRENN